jgi:excisionase family DNA binding protein
MKNQQRHDHLLCPPPPALTPRGLRIPDAANYMGVTPWYVEVVTRSGELPALKLGRHYTILREDLDGFLDRKQEYARGRRFAAGHA